MKSGATALIPFVVIVVILSLLGASFIDVFPNSDDGDQSAVQNISDSSSYSITSSSNTNETSKVVLDGNTGAELKGDGTYKIGSNVTVTATCDDDTKFIAWLDSDGNVVSEDATYTFKITSSKTVSLFASCITSMDWVNGASQLYRESGWTSAVWTVYEYDGDNLTKIGTSTNGRFAFPSAGMYRVVISAVDSDGNDVKMTSELSVGEIVFGYTWSYGRYTFTVEAEIQFSDYEDAVDDTVGRSLQSNLSNALTFVTPDEPCVSEIAEQISQQATKYGITDEEDIANIVLDLVQMSITYTEDSEQYGEEEYLAFPIQTLYSQKGDCEDTTFLFASIMKAMGYDTLVCYVQYGGAVNGGHAFAMVALDSCDGTSYRIQQGRSTVNASYYYCETTPDGDFGYWNVGSTMQDYNSIVESYCFMTDDGKSIPTEYTIYKSRMF